MAAARYARQRSKIEEAFQKGDHVFNAAEKTVERPAVASKRTKFLDAVRLYETAAEAYLAAGKWNRAALAYARCAECELKLNRTLEAASFYAQAGEYASRVDHTSAIRYYALSVANWVKDGHFQQAAAAERRLGEVCEDDEAHAEAGKAYTYAAELYVAADIFQQAAYMFYCGGIAFAQAEFFAQSAKEFEMAANAADKDNMLRYTVPHFLVCACLAMFATGDIPDTEDLMLRFCEEYPLFACRREKQFIMDLIFCAKGLLYDAFIDHIWNFDYVSELKYFQLQLLQRANEMFIAEVEESERARKDAEIAARKAALTKRKPVATDLGMLLGTSAVAGGAGGVGADER